MGKRTPAPMVNMLTNPGFEQIAAGGIIPGWTPVRQGGATVSDSVYHGGRYSLKVEDLTGSVNGGAWSDIFAAQPGERFRAEAYVRVEQGTAVLYMEFVNAAGQHHSFADPWKSSPTSGNWVYAIVEGTVPEGAAGVRIMPYSGVSTTCVGYFDDISLVRRGDFSVKPQFGPVQTIPDAVMNKLGNSGAVGRAADGTPETYFFGNGAPGTFYALNAATGEKLFSEQLPGENIVWGMTFSPDGNVYFASLENGRLYRYSPTLRKIDNLGVNPSGTFVWDLGASPDGRYIYGGVYPTGKMFEYDTQTSTFRDLGVMKPGKQYVRGLGVSDSYVYAGLGTYADSESRVVVRYDRRTGAKTDIVVPTTATFINDVYAYGAKLFVSAGSLYVLDAATFGQIDAFPFSGKLSPPSPDDANLVYYTNGKNIYSYLLDTGAKQDVGTMPSMSATGMVALDWVHPAAGPFAGKNVLSGTSLYGDGFLFDPVSGSSVSVNLAIGGSPVQTHVMKAAPDGKLYLGGYHQGVSIYDPLTRSFLVQQFHTPQPESIGFLNGKVYYGMYTGAQIFEYDPVRPWQFGTAAGSNPYLAYDIQDEDRPYVMASGDNKLFIGTFPNYGHLGGKLTVHNTVDNTWKEYTNSSLVHNQSITGLAYRDGKLYGSTSIRGGLGIEPTEAQGKLVIWDVAGERKIMERSLDLPGHQPPLIGNLAFGPDGLLWGVTGSAIFALDPVTLDVVKSRTLYSPNLDNLGAYRPFELYVGDDGYLYTTIGLSITVIDPDTLEFEQLVPKADFSALGKDGSIYYAFSKGKDLYRLPVKLQSVTISTYASALPLHGSAVMGLEGLLANGKQANLGAATIRYTSSDPQTVSVDVYGRATGSAIGEADIRAEVSLDGTTVESAPIRIRVVADAPY
ncbi:hypothetical protein ACFFNY_05380 [Paenibacillus hodogayensis]|uniref:CBM-cenC domain-containing protein n=1 Tax=Paenibacillus hodogayensis TaxID=279208 RepID=A0ABV5VRV9_9BACL